MAETLHGNNCGQDKICQFPSRDWLLGAFRPFIHPSDSIGPLCSACARSRSRSSNPIRSRLGEVQDLEKDPSGAVGNTGEQDAQTGH